jgi:FKBP-type peptidyl-prolyl cis-trans isomerase
LEAAPYLKQGRPASANAERPTLKGKSGVEHRLVKDATGSLVPLDMVELQHPTEPDSPRVQRRDAVLVRYIARLEDGTVIEDKRRNKAPVLFRAGTATLPAAVDLGVEGMRVGEERRIRVRARDNFHGVNLRLGAAATVPRDALLFYDVELVGINPYK